MPLDFCGRAGASPLNYKVNNPPYKGESSLVARLVSRTRIRRSAELPPLSSRFQWL